MKTEAEKFLFFLCYSLKITRDEASLRQWAEIACRFTMFDFGFYNRQIHNFSKTHQKPYLTLLNLSSVGIII